jgi:hypothetical protein
MDAIQLLVDSISQKDVARADDTNQTVRPPSLLFFSVLFFPFLFCPFFLPSPPAFNVKAVATL